jgi:pyrimidine-specific ribonucleoside hydrolase
MKNRGERTMKKPVIIDCDPGVDDAVALLLGLTSDKLDVRAITVVAGNQTIDKTAQNALDIVTYLGAEVKVAKGATRPLVRELHTAGEVHGESGLGRLRLPRSGRSLYGKTAYDTIYEELTTSKEKLHIITLGPLTNIAITLITYPEVKEKVEHITLMGGACMGGNVTPAAEFNIFADPEAAKVVFESGIPLTMVGLDATLKAYIDREEVDELTVVKNKISDMTRELMYSLLSINEGYGIKGAVMHDPLAVASVINPELITTKKCHVDIETCGEFTRGRTVVDFNNTKDKPLNADVALDADRIGFIKMLQDMINRFNN